MTAAPVGVGIVGAGPVVQAIHLPTLARLPGLFAVRNIMDVSAEVAQSVAARVGARASTSIEELLADDEVEVVAVCSPSAFHAPQVIAAMRAGKRAVLCEKPFATDREQAELIADVSRETGVPVVVGAMHTYDPVWRGVMAEWGERLQDVHTIRSRIVLPPNAQFESWATEVLSSRPALGPADLANPDVRSSMVSGGVLGLAIHDLPLVRRILPSADRVEVFSASAISPWGYEIGMVVDGRTVQLMGALTEQWRTSWRFEALTPTAHLAIEFTPSYVHAGSGTATLTSPSGTQRLNAADHNGYEGEWRALHSIVSDGGRSAPPLQTLIDDLLFAVDIASVASEMARREVVLR